MTLSDNKLKFRHPHNGEGGGERGQTVFPPLILFVFSQLHTVQTKPNHNLTLLNKFHKNGLDHRHTPHLIHVCSAIMMGPLHI